MSDAKTDPAAPKSPAQSLTDQAAVLTGQAAVLNAQAALQKAQADSIPASGTSGAVTANAGAGNREATLLAAAALQHAADKLVGRIKDALGGELLIVAGAPLALPNFEAFQVQADIVRLTFDRATHVLHAVQKALEDFEKPKHESHTSVWSLHPTADHVSGQWLQARIAAGVAPVPDRAGIAPAAGAAAAAAALAVAAPALLPVIGPFGGAIAAVGAAVDVASKLATYFKPDFSIGAATASGADDQLLASCVAHAVTAKHETAVHVQGLWNGLHRPDALAHLLKPLIEASQKLAALAEQVRHKANLLTADGKAKGATPPTPPAPTTPPAPPAAPTAADNARANLANAVAAALDFYTAAEKGFDALVSSLATVTKDGLPAASAVLAEKTIADFLAEGGHVLWVKVSAVSSSTYTKKSWRPALNVPLYVASGVVVEYALTRGKSGALVKAGVITEPGHFVSINELVDKAGESHKHFLSLFGG